MASIDIANIIMLVLMTLITPLQGFFIFVAYCLNKKVLLPSSALSLLSSHYSLFPLPFPFSHNCLSSYI
jgi:hypothetical protein